MQDILKQFGANKHTAKLAEFIHDQAMASTATHTDELKELKATDEAKANDTLINLYYEYLYLYMHIVNRLAFGMLGGDGRNRLHDHLCPVIAVKSIDTFYNTDDPTDLIRSIINEANSREGAYAECSTFVPSGDDPFSTNAMSVVLAEQLCKMIYGERDDNMLILGMVTASNVVTFSEQINVNNIKDLMQKA